MSAHTQQPPDTWGKVGGGAPDDALSRDGYSIRLMSVLCLLVLAPPGRYTDASVAKDSQLGLQHPTCANLSEPSIRITSDSVGPFPVRMKARDITSMCPAARETTYTSLEGAASPALRMQLNGLEVFAIQHRARLAHDERVDIWVLTKIMGACLGDIPLSSNWGELRSLFGEASGTTEIGVTMVWFTGAPKLTLVLDTDPATAGPLDFTHDLSRIPDSAKVVQVMISARP